MFGNSTISSRLCEARSQAELGARLGGSLVSPAGLKCHPLIAQMFLFFRSQTPDILLVDLSLFHLSCQLKNPFIHSVRCHR